MLSEAAILAAESNHPYSYYGWRSKLRFDMTWRRKATCRG